MRKILLTAIILSGCGSNNDSLQQNSDASALPSGELRGAPEHVQLQKGQAKPSSGGSGSTLLTSHGGPVLRTNSTVAIFWGSEWSSSTFAKDKIVGLDSFFAGFSGSQYASTGNEYYDATGHVTATSTYVGHMFDLHAAPRRAITTSTAVAEVCALTSNAPDPQAVYFLYTSTAAGQVNYCAWHSWGTCSNGAKVQVAYMPNIDGIAGCDPVDTTSGHSEGLAALANVTAHELLEAMTDPRGTGWMDSSGQENGDKCAWSFPSVLSSLSNGSQWKLQMEWSNAAYLSSTGLPNSNGQRACIY